MLTLERALALHQAGTLDAAAIRALPVEARERLHDEWAAWFRRDHQANQIVYYEAVSPEAEKIHLTMAREVGCQGGNKSSKTGTMLAEMVIQLLGVPGAVPESLRGRYPVQKLRGIPIRWRLVVTSLTTAWDTNLKPKLQWWMWNGRPNGDGLQGDPRVGHWGFIPQAWLLHGDWNASWSEKHRTLTLRNPATGAAWSSVQVMGHDQDIKEFNQGAYHGVTEDEIPPEDVHRANLIRVMEYGGQVFTGGTPPDDRSSAVTAAWFLDTVLRPGFEATNPEEAFAVALWTEHNRTLDQAWVQKFTKSLTADQRRARLHGDFLHLAGAIIKGFTERAVTWCFTCAQRVDPQDGTCPTCGRRDLTGYRHVWDDDDLDWPGPATWPALFYMDPHQARPTACAWFKVDPNDAWWQIGELEVPGNALAVKTAVLAYEAQHHLDVLWRKGDPKITAQRNQFAVDFEGEVFSIGRAFEEAGFPFDPANTNFTVAIDRIEDALRPNPFTRVPRLRVHASCTRSIYQITHFSWSAGSRRENVNIKDDPSRKDSDFPALHRYLAMDDPDWRSLQAMRHVRPVSLVHGGTGRNARTGW